MEQAMPWKPLPDVPKEELSDILKEITKKASFLVDESLGIAVAQALRMLGWNVRFVDEVGLRGHDDSDVFAFASRENRILLTHDEDFLDDRKFPPHRNPGIVVLPGASGEERELLKALGAMLSIVGKFRGAWLRAKIQISRTGDWVVKRWDSATGSHQIIRYKFPNKGAPLMWDDK
jgi:predicted nuclease of predicted toxin-antitoxin system